MLNDWHKFQFLAVIELNWGLHHIHHLWRHFLKPGHLNKREHVLHFSLTVRFSGSKHFSTNLRMLATHPSSEECQRSEQPKVKVERDFSPRFMVDWCRVVIVSTTIVFLALWNVCWGEGLGGGLHGRVLNVTAQCRYSGAPQHPSNPQC